MCHLNIIKFSNTNINKNINNYHAKCVHTTQYVQCSGTSQVRNRLNIHLIDQVEGLQGN